MLADKRVDQRQRASGNRNRGKRPHSSVPLGRNIFCSNLPQQDRIHKLHHRVAGHGDDGGPSESPNLTQRAFWTVQTVHEEQRL